MAVSFAAAWRLHPTLGEILKTMQHVLRTIHTVAIALLVSAVPVAAQNYPSKPIRLIVPNAAGGSTDLVARTTANKLSDSLGQPVVIENRAGSGGIIGAELVARSAPDGYTLLMGTIGNLVISPHLYPNLAYDPLRDFAPVAQVASAAYFLVVHPAVPARSVNELVALAKARPGQLAYASAGSGTGSHLATELFLSVARIDVTHVPYKGGTPGLTDLISGQVQLMFNGIPSSLPHIKSGRIRPLALTAAKRTAAAPGVPTMAESGYAGAESTSWTGLLAPAGTPRAIVERLNADLRKALQAPEVRTRLAADGADPVGSSPEAFSAYIKVELAKWGKVVKASGAKAD